jgi:hypothetical protein
MPDPNREKFREIFITEEMENPFHGYEDSYLSNALENLSEKVDKLTARIDELEKKNRPSLIIRLEPNQVGAILKMMGISEGEKDGKYY